MTKLPSDELADPCVTGGVDPARPGEVRPGPHNHILDVAGLALGHAEDRTAWTGVTVILPQHAATAAVDVRGGGPGTRETDALAPASLVGKVDAIVLSGGSVFGLAAADSITAALALDGVGVSVRGHQVPIVPAAILFDLANGGDKAWPYPPYGELGRAAYADARRHGKELGLGNIGAGYGATAGKLKGGLGSASLLLPAGMEGGGSGMIAVGAIVAANPHGSVVIPGTSSFWAWPFEIEAEFGGRPPPARLVLPDLEVGTKVPAAGANTTLAIVATDAHLTRPEALRVAMMAQDGIARAVRPAHTPFDGDIVFALATGRWHLAGERPRLVARIGAVAADCLARAIARAVYQAAPLGCWPAYRDVALES